MRDMKPLLSLLFVATAASLSAGQREVVSGYMTPVNNLDYEFLFSYRPGGAAFFELIDQMNDPGALKTFPRARVEVERSPFPSDRGVALRLLPSELLAPAGVPLSPERWAGANTGLHPTLHENQPFEVTGPSDFDGDGVADHLDLFPDDPAESADNDSDGTGNHADPDDDNDLMPDSYEAANGLDPFTADGEADPDNDGYSNAEESAAGTAAQDGISYFHIETVEFPAPDKIVLYWQALPGRRYEIWHRPRLEPRGSRLAEDIRVSDSGLFSYALETAPEGDFYFIQVIADPP
jgi:hypothetical protein